MSSSQFLGKPEFRIFSAADEYQKPGNKDIFDGTFKTLYDATQRKIQTPTKATNKPRKSFAPGDMKMPISPGTPIASPMSSPSKETVATEDDSVEKLQTFAATFQVDIIEINSELQRQIASIIVSAIEASIEDVSEKNLEPTEFFPQIQSKFIDLCENFLLTSNKEKQTQNPTHFNRELTNLLEEKETEEKPAERFNSLLKKLLEKNTEESFEIELTEIMSFDLNEAIRTLKLAESLAEQQKESERPTILRGGRKAARDYLKEKFNNILREGIKLVYHGETTETKSQEKAQNPLIEALKKLIDEKDPEALKKLDRYEHYLQDPLIKQIIFEILVFSNKKYPEQLLAEYKSSITKELQTTLERECKSKTQELETEIKAIEEEIKQAMHAKQEDLKKVYDNLIEKRQSIKHMLEENAEQYADELKTITSETKETFNSLNIDPIPDEIKNSHQTIEALIQQINYEKESFDKNKETLKERIGTSILNPAQISKGAYNQQSSTALFDTSTIAGYIREIIPSIFDTEFNKINNDEKLSESEKQDQTDYFKTSITKKLKKLIQEQFSSKNYTDSYREHLLKQPDEDIREELQKIATLVRYLELAEKTFLESLNGLTQKIHLLKQEQEKFNKKIADLEKTKLVPQEESKEAPASNKNGSDYLDEIAPPFDLEDSSPSDTPSPGSPPPEPAKEPPKTFAGSLAAELDELEFPPDFAVSTVATASKISAPDDLALSHGELKSEIAVEAGGAAISAAAKAATLTDETQASEQTKKTASPEADFAVTVGEVKLESAQSTLESPGSPETKKTLSTEEQAHTSVLAGNSYTPGDSKRATPLQDRKSIAGSADSKSTTASTLSTFLGFAPTPQARRVSVWQPAVEEKKELKTEVVKPKRSTNIDEMTLAERKEFTLNQIKRNIQFAKDLLLSFYDTEIKQKEAKKFSFLTLSSTKKNHTAELNRLKNNKERDIQELHNYLTATVENFKNYSHLARPDDFKMFTDDQHIFVLNRIVLLLKKAENPEIANEKAIEKNFSFDYKMINDFGSVSSKMPLIENLKSAALLIANQYRYIAKITTGNESNYFTQAIEKYFAAQKNPSPTPSEMKKYADQVETILADLATNCNYGENSFGVKFTIRRNKDESIFDGSIKTDFDTPSHAKRMKLAMAARDYIADMKIISASMNLDAKEISSREAFFNQQIKEILSLKFYSPEDKASTKELKDCNDKNNKILQPHLEAILKAMQEWDTFKIKMQSKERTPSKTQEAKTPQSKTKPPKSKASPADYTPEGQGKHLTAMAKLLASRSPKKPAAGAGAAGAAAPMKTPTKLSFEQQQAGFHEEAFETLKILSAQRQAASNPTSAQEAADSAQLTASRKLIDALQGDEGTPTKTQSEDAGTPGTPKLGGS